MKTCNATACDRFLSGSMSDIETTAFEDHLEVCDVCRQQLDAKAGGIEWESSRELLAYSSNRPMVDAHSADSDWLTNCTSAQVLQIVAPSDDPAMVGRIGPYEISGLLGRGSAGIVLKGFDRALNRNVAIKILDPALAGAGAARQRFSRAARAMAAISHEHLVPVFEVNEHAGLPFFVMEYVPGGSLERRLRSEGPLDVVSVVRIGIQSALALIGRDLCIVTLNRVTSCWTAARSVCVWRTLGWFELRMMPVALAAAWLPGPRNTCHPNRSVPNFVTAAPICSALVL